MEFQYSNNFLVLGNPASYHILIGQDIPPPLDGDTTIKAVLIFAKDGDDYGYIALRDMGANNLGIIIGFVIAGSNLNSDGFISLDSDTASVRQIDINRIMRINGSGLLIHAADIVYDDDDANDVDISGDLQSNWSAGGAGEYITVRKRHGFVYVRWNLNRAGANLAANTASPFLTLATKYRPENLIRYACGGNTNTGTYGLAESTTAGVVGIVQHAGITTNQHTQGEAVWPVVV